jgi:hypothetical protein
MVDQEVVVLSWEVLMYDNYWMVSCFFMLDGILVMVEAPHEEWLMNSIKGM